MSRWHRENPDYLETGAEPPDYRAHADNIRKRQKEEPEHRPCGVCGGPVETLADGVVICKARCVIPK